MAAAFSGSLNCAGIAPVIALLRDLRRSGRLHVFHGRCSGDVWLDGGQVIAAAFGSQRGLPALKSLVLALASGQFAFFHHTSVEERTIAETPEQIQAYLERLTARHAELPVPAPAAVPQVVAASVAPGMPDEAVIDHLTLRTLAAVDGRRTVDEIVDARGTAEAVVDLVTLADLGLIRFAPPPAARA